MIFKEILQNGSAAHISKKGLKDKLCPLKDKRTKKDALTVLIIWEDYKKNVEKNNVKWFIIIQVIRS